MRMDSEGLIAEGLNEAQSALDGFLNELMMGASALQVAAAALAVSAIAF